MKKLLLVLLCLPMIGFGQNWNQLGQDIDGEGPNYDESGHSVFLSGDGQTVAIGAPENHQNNGAGHVRIYRWDGSSWNQLGSDLDGEMGGYWSGYSVSLSANGEIVAIGAPENGDNGHVRIYSWNGSSWIQLGVDIEGEGHPTNSGDYSGWSVSLSYSGSRVAIGAWNNMGINGYGSGHVRIYEFNSSNWIQLGSDIDGEAEYDESGYSVSLSGDGQTVAIKAIYNDGNGNLSGHVRVYQYNGTSWSQIGNDIDGEATGDNFLCSNNYSVSLSSDGTTVAIGAPFNDGSGNNSGHVRVYQNVGGTWTQIGSDIDGEAAFDQSGWSVSLSSDGQTVAIGAINNSGNGAEAGHVRIYNWNGVSWVQLGADIDGEAGTDRSGWSVSLSSDGSRVAIGAPSNDGNGFNVGHVRVYATQPVSVLSITNIEKKLFKIIDMLGRKTKQTNQPLFYIYNDGTVEKKVVIE